jgi:hypothetical protein
MPKADDDAENLINMLPMYQPVEVRNMPATLVVHIELIQIIL